ncbi:MAG: hypothetical protein WD929_09570 [Steroidobacteraceae bacterium]
MPTEPKAVADPLQHNTFLTRTAATAALIDAGVPLSPKSLEYMATKGTGPKFRIVNGRAVYRRGDLQAWMNDDDRAAGAA